MKPLYGSHFTQFQVKGPASTIKMHGLSRPGGSDPILDLLGGAGIGVSHGNSHQMDPEYSTSALVAWHLQARYFSA